MVQGGSYPDLAPGMKLGNNEKGKPTMQPCTIIPAAQARREYLGDVAPSTLWRWEREIADFPKAIRIGERKFYRVADLELFLASRQVA